MKNKRTKKSQARKYSGELSRLYSVFVWPHSPENQEGKEYYESALRFMKTLIDHSWMKRMIAKKKDIKILEICGGAGFGGMALSKVLSEKSVKVDLLITDLRKDALNIAKKWGSKVLKGKVDISVIDAREVHNLKKKFDLTLIYGLATPHFNPWELVRVFASVSEVLAEDGLFVVDESDRRYRLFIDQGYKWALAEGFGDKYVMDFHTGYDLIRGTCKKTFINPDKMSKKTSTEIFMWGLAEVGALTWAFYNDVDMLSLGVGGTRHFILGYKPRKKLMVNDLNQPTVLKKLSGK